MTRRQHSAGLDGKLLDGRVQPDIAWARLATLAEVAAPATKPFYVGMP